MSNLLPPLKNIHTREMIDPELRSLSEVLLEGRGVLRGEMGSAPPTPDELPPTLTNEQQTGPDS